MWAEAITETNIAQWSTPPTHLLIFGDLYLWYSSTAKPFPPSTAYIWMNKESLRSSNSDTHVIYPSSLILSRGRYIYGLLMSWGTISSYISFEQRWTGSTQLMIIRPLLIQGPAEIPWRFSNTAVSGTVGVGNLSLSALLARLKAFQLPWSAGL